MEQGIPTHQQRTSEGALVPLESYTLPLLPYERDLIAQLGVSEEEYRDFAAQVSSRIRYDQLEGVPTNDAVITPILINLAIGLILTGVSMLLAPKPQDNEQKKQKTFEITSKTGRTRFNNSVGFDGAPALAQLGSRIPIPFGLFEPDTPGAVDADIFKQSGGILVEPLLVWSRMTSHGKFQTLKFLTIIGQASIEQVPDLAGIFIGGQPLGNFFQTNYWVAYKSVVDDNRLFLADQLYGRAAEGPDGNGGIFVCPTLEGDREPGFSAAHTPANTTSFGVYQTIPNGGSWRVNWEVISFPKLEDQKDDPKYYIQSQRKKIAGEEGKTRDSGMRGIGRPYSNKCGVVAFNGNEYRLPTEIAEVNLGDRITYRISGGQFDYDNTSLNADSGIGIQDLNSTTNTTRERADDLLQPGEVFMMNRTIFRVTSRNQDVWTASSGTYNYDLEVIGFTGANRTIGIIGTQNVEKYVLGEGGDSDPSEAFKGTGWYPLSKVDFGQVKNTRAVEVTEIGIKAQLWSKASGLFNFNETPSPEKLREMDEDGYNIKSGAISKYMRRTAFFMLAVRDPQDIQGYTASDGTEDSLSDDLMEGYDILGDVSFAVSGTTPVDQFSYIRIQHPGKIGLEYRLIPKPATTIIRNQDAQNQSVLVLNASGELKTRTVTSPYYGTFRLQFNASEVPLPELLDLPEVQAGDYTVPERREDCIATSAPDTTPPQGGGYLQAFLESLDNGNWNLKPVPGNPRKNVYGQRRSTTFQARSDRGSVIIIAVDGTVIDAGGEARLASHGTAKAWSAGFRYSSGDEVEDGEVFYSTRTVSSTWHGQYFGINSATRQYTTGAECLTIIPGYTTTREFENNAAIKELSPYQEISKSCDDNPEFMITYVNESTSAVPAPNYYAMSMLGFKIRSLNRTTSFNQVQVWLPNGISINRLQPQLFNNIDGGAAYGPSNNFADFAYYLLTDESAGSGALGREISDKLVARGWFEYTARFLDGYWMRFDGALADSVNIRDYLTQLAPYFLCNFVMINGKFALKPALPMAGDRLNEGPIDVAMMFNDGTIAEGTFKLSYLQQSERQDFRANMIYRLSEKNSLVEKRSILVQWRWDENEDSDTNNNITTINQEDFDLSEFCTRRSHAFAVARYMLSTRRRVDHVIEFKTNPEGLSLAPGDFIRVDTKMSPYENFQNGVVTTEGAVVSPAPIKDGKQMAYVFRQGTTEVVLEEIEFLNNRVTDETLFGALFNVPNIARRLGIYAVESIGIEEDGLIKITGSHHPVFEDLSSKIVYDVLHPTEQFTVVEEG
jgi:hypothetical protein